MQSILHVAIREIRASVFDYRVRYSTLYRYDFATAAQVHIADQGEA